jgi:hypothetical protein
MHAVLLAIALAAILPITRPGVAYTSDEGAAILQARLLRNTGDWIETYPLQAVDPTGAARPFPKAAVGSKGLAPYAKHPAYPLLLAAVDGGWLGLYAVGLVGTVLAALGAAVLAQQVRRAPAVLTLWVVGLGTPLFFDTFVVLAHTLAAAAAVWAVVAAARFVDRPGGRMAVAAAVSVIACAFLRSEGVLFAVALAAGLAVVGVRTRRFRSAVPLAAIVGASGIAVRFAESVAGHAILGGGTTVVTSPVATVGFLDGRLDALRATWFTASYDAPRSSDALLFAACIAIASAAVLLRLGRARRGAAVLAVVATIAIVGRALQGLPDAVPGLALAFPVGWGGAWLLRGHHLRGVVESLAITTVAVFVGFVLATQYSFGGGVEWGGRFFALAIPVATPFLLLALRDAVAAAFGRRGWTIAVALTVICSAALGVLAVQALRRTHIDTTVALDSTRAAAHRAGNPRLAGGERPIVVTTMRLYPQIVWPVYFDYRWAAPEREDLASLVCRLAGAGVERLVLATPTPTEDLRAISPAYRSIAQPEPNGDRSFVPSFVLQRRTNSVCTSIATPAP